MDKASRYNCKTIYAYFSQTHSSCFRRRHTARFKPRKTTRTATLSVVAFKNFGDGLLDYMEAGPKLRKWYGESEKQPRDGRRPEQGEEPEDELPRDAILVTDADSPTGELVILQLILARLKVTALVKDAVAARTAYGSYVTPVQGSVGNGDSLLEALGTARAVICPAKVGVLSQALSRRQVDHVVLLSSVGTQEMSMFGRLFGSEQATLTDPEREAALRECDAPLTIVRVGKIVGRPGGGAEMTFAQGNSAPQGDISREDVAQVLVRALQKRPKTTLTFAVNSRATGQQTRDWDRLFAELNEVSAA